MAFEHYIYSGGKKLRCGFTTGTCAALAASGCARRLLTGAWPETVSILTPKGLRVEVPLEACRMEGEWAVCGVRKDAGDDIDRTADALICAALRPRADGEITIDGGPGVGRVTKPGLDQPVGAAAINSVPRQMIARAVAEVRDAVEDSGGFEIVISVPEGERIAAQTFNPELGIVGGISILGTSGIVEPMSVQALVDTIALELRSQAHQGHRRVILTPGSYGLDYLRGIGLDRLGVPVVKCSNFIGDALDEAMAQGFEAVLLIGHAGKLSKLAGGIMNTHSRVADCRTELICAHAAVCGADQDTCRRLLEASTIDACIEILDEQALREPVFTRLTQAVEHHLLRRAAGAYQVGAILFSNRFGPLGETQGAKEIIAQWKRESEPSMPSASAPGTRSC
ncbi:MAG: cobalamin biosynthesis protein CbiD [Oscillospiraceae bacterium]|nr:cobalamin biosynthesis protein CbiD [Oscillospiraceae bacterium]